MASEKQMNNGNDPPPVCTPNLRFSDEKLALSSSLAFILLQSLKLVDHSSISNPQKMAMQ